MLFLTFAVRVYHLDVVQFDSDFGRDSLFGFRILTEKFTLLGPQASVGGFYLGPFYFYAIAALFFLIGPIPEFLMLSFAVLNMIAAAIGYQFLSRRLGVHAGVIFLLLFSTQHLLVQASRTATHAPILPFITVLSIIMLIRSLESKQRVAYLFSGMTLGLFWHVHFSALLLFPGYFILVSIVTPGNWKKKVEAIILHGLGVSILLLPLVLFDLRHEWITSRAFVDYIILVIKGESIREAFPHWSMTTKVSELARYIGPTRVIQVVTALAALFGAQRSLGLKQSKQKTFITVTSLLALSMITLLLLYPGYLFTYYLIVPGTVLIFTLSILLSQLRVSWIGVTLALLISVLTARTLKLLYVQQFRTISNLERVTNAIKVHQDNNGKPLFNLYKDSSDGLTVLGYEYRFLLTRDRYVPTSEYAYQDAQILYVIREEGTNDPLTLGGHEMGQFSGTKIEKVTRLYIHDRTVDVFALTK